MPHLIDLRHLGHARVIASHLVEGDEPALVDCGPSTCIDALEDGLRERGLELTDVRHLLLTHIHLDHAGAAGSLVRKHPGLRVHVSEVGAPHVIDPSRLERSARRIYGDDFDRLWGKLVPVPEENVEVLGSRVLGLDAFPTPGHAVHHVTFLGDDGSCFTGDAAGVRIAPSRYVASVAPPPDIDVEAWDATLDAIAARRPRLLCLPHFGVVDDPAEHLEAMRERLHLWVERVGAGASEEDFVAAAEREIETEAAPETREAYRQAAPAWQSYAGLRRYWDKKRPGAGSTST
ncbi:MAG: MBL fold metallo-hydrolase [Actinobacteria bacterium]|nr:MBL fold metallo-hydrolase [Actinomycetota bacterium]